MALRKLGRTSSQRPKSNACLTTNLIINKQSITTMKLTKEIHKSVEK